MLAPNNGPGNAVEDTQYHVVLEGRKVGPYDRRTVVGMRIKKTLTANHVLIGVEGRQLTVGELLGEGEPPRRSERFNPTRSGGFSIVQATYTARVAAAHAGSGVPRFVGEVEARIQGGMIRIAGRFKRGFRWKEDRVKIPIRNILQARARGTVTELWLHDERGGRPRRVALDMGSPEVAAELLQWMPDATPYVDPPAPAGRAQRNPRNPAVVGIVVAAAGLVAVVAVVLAVLVVRR